ncbi:MAG: hypothetical protein P1P84_02770 [Deferrisomatales bacterium]|nr:hypothetical protein [Deferrisomatales bacterium]
MQKFKLILHVEAEVEAESMNIAKAVLEGRSVVVEFSEPASPVGAYAIEVQGAHASEVKGPRTSGMQHEKAAPKIRTV